MREINDKYGLSSRVKLEKISENHISIVKLIKSRIIQKDALKIIEQANTIREKDPNMKVNLICHNNICSKSVALLIRNKIEIVFKD
jgi:hypothetical protein